MSLYIAVTIWITVLVSYFRNGEQNSDEVFCKFKVEMNDLDAFARGRAVDSLLNFETVKFFGNECILFQLIIYKHGK
jgi:ABC-type transport system involved in Fe-S cluster assembly fused permease/ATPase subunit